LIATESAWALRAPELAEWAYDLANTLSHWGAYPGPFVASGTLTHELLEDHFRGSGLIGLHSKGKGSARWLAVDIDNHGEADPEANLELALSLYDRAKARGFHPILEDSDGQGGYHLWLVLDKPYPTGRVASFGRTLLQGGRAELFPANGADNKGTWLRLPGKHHTRNHWSRVWSGSEWLSEGAAIDLILAVEGSPCPLAQDQLSASRLFEPPDLERVKAALSFLDPDTEYNDWVAIGMSLRELGDDGLAIWCEWSSRGRKYVPGECETKWESFSPDGGRTLGTLFHKAKEAGWKARPEILLTTEVEQVNNAAIAALRGSQGLYQRGERLVEIVDSRIQTIGKPRLRELLSSAATWKKIVKGKKQAPAIPPDWAVDGVLARGTWNLRELAGIVEAPTLRPDGTVVSRPGYDATTRLFYAPGCDFGEIPDSPTRGDARRAAKDLLDLVQDFPFEGSEDKAAWLAALLTPFARYAIDDPVPAFVVSANAAGVGKSLLTDLISILATGKKLPRTPYSGKDSETRKLITSLLLEGRRLVLFDNLGEGVDFGGSELEAAITGSVWGDRLLSTNSITELEIKTCWYLTGNKVRVAGDQVRRSVLIRLKTELEHPEDRSEFHHLDLLAYVLANRPRLVRAALTILQAGGDPLTLGSFETWSRLVRSAVKAATGQDPCATREDLRAEDPRTDERLALLQAWGEIGEHTVAEAIALIRDGKAPALANLLQGRANQTDLGYRLRGARDRVTRGLVLRALEDKHRKVRVWKVEIAGDCG
jgi:hypothetical protein